MCYSTENTRGPYTYKNLLVHLMCLSPHGRGVGRADVESYLVHHSLVQGNIILDGIWLFPV